ncbi:MAG: hypothetical protein JSV07_06845 [Acidimicrobiia bacterium]|nr:MAG: hypothetical protein JSV07_06845 [Acidimicrobiia bacterium]
MTATCHLRIYIPADEAPDEVIGLPPAEPSADARWHMGEFGIVAEPQVDDAVFVEHDGQRFVCPRRPRLRLLESVLAFHNGFTGLGGEVIVPEAAARRAAEELDRLREGGRRSLILTAQWHVPLRWFLLFRPEERLVRVGEGQPEVVYRTTRRAASRRMRRAIRALRGAGMAAVTEEMEQLVEWLSAFPPEWLVELDYGSVVHLFDDALLLLDASCEDLWDSIEALEAGDPMLARDRYERVAAHWAPAMRISYSN